MNVARISLSFLCPLFFPEELTNTSKRVRATSRCGTCRSSPHCFIKKFSRTVRQSLLLGLLWGVGSVRIFADCCYTARKPEEKQTTHLPLLSNPGKKGEATFSITRIKEHFPPTKFQSAANKPTTFKLTSNESARVENLSLRKHRYILLSRSFPGKDLSGASHPNPAVPAAAGGRSATRGVSSTQDRWG